MPNLSTIIKPLCSIKAQDLNGGQPGDAPIYGCRAWVNFDGTTANNLVGTYGRSGTTITVTATNHGLRVGHRVDMTFAAGTGGTATSQAYIVVSVISSNQFTLTDTATGTITGNPAATIRRRLIRAAGNVANVGYSTTGAYIINFATALPSSSYCVSGMGRFDNSGLNLDVPMVGLYRGAVTATPAGAGPTENYCHLAVINQGTTGGTDCNLVSVNIFC